MYKLRININEYVVRQSLYLSLVLERFATWSDNHVHLPKSDWVQKRKYKIILCGAVPTTSWHFSFNFCRNGSHDVHRSRNKSGRYEQDGHCDSSPLCDSQTHWESMWFLVLNCDRWLFILLLSV
jgi:hypothetical protein